MSIDAKVESVYINEDGSGQLNLVDRPAGTDGTPGIAGQKVLRFLEAPEEITALNGLNIWGSSSCIMLGDKWIARRNSYTSVKFVGRSEFNEAVKEYHRKHYQPSNG